MICPGCGGKNPEPTKRSAFIEIGEWDGKSYEDEGPVYEYKCKECGMVFYVG